MTAALAEGLGALPATLTEDVLQHARPALRTFFRIAQVWDLTADEQRNILGLPPRSTFYKWRAGETGGVQLATMERLSHVFGIYGALHRIFLDPARADAWLRRPNDAPPFDGQPAMAWLLSGRIADLYDVRRYLEGVAEYGL